MRDFGKAPRTRRVSAANLEHECFEQESTACSLVQISRAEHRHSSKSWGGAKGGAGAERLKGGCGVQQTRVFAGESGGKGGEGGW